MNRINKLIILCFIYQLSVIINKTTDEKKGTNTPTYKNNNKNNINIIHKEAVNNNFNNLFEEGNTNKECYNELKLILKKDFKELSSNLSPNLSSNFSNPYNKTLLNSEKLLNRTSTQITKKLNKYNFYENKNFTGIRWINTKYFTGEVKKLVEDYFTNLAIYFETKYFNCKNQIPEFIIENYFYFFTKFNEIKKLFKQFYLFRGIKKYMACMSKKDYGNLKFGENLMNGNITIKKMLLSLNNFVFAVKEMIKVKSLDGVIRVLNKIMVNMKGYPIL